MARRELRAAMQFQDLAQEHHAAELGMWLFLATEVLFIGALFAAYSFLRVMHPEGFLTGSHHTEVVLGTANTAVLLTSSLSMALGVRAARLGENRAVLGWLLLTALLGSVFLGIKGVEYLHEFRAGLVPGLHFTYDGAHTQSVQVFFFLYFVMTGVHALHLLIGIGAVLAIAAMAARGRFARRYHAPVEVTGLYWHFVDVVWVFLFPLLYLIGRA